MIQLPEINNKRVTIWNSQQKRLSGHAHTQLTSTIFDQLVNMWSWAACSSRYLLYLQAHFSIWWNDSFSSSFLDSLNHVQFLWHLNFKISNLKNIIISKPNMNRADHATWIRFWWNASRSICRSPLSEKQYTPPNSDVAEFYRISSS